VYEALDHAGIKHNCKIKVHRIEAEKVEQEGAEKALQDLTTALQDSDENVRLAAADAIATIGSGAATAVPQLIEACDRPGEHVHVLRSVAKALGNTGGAAAPAIPALEKLERIPRVEWPAREAITKITAKTSGQAR